jgi:hypothetical protein
MAELMEVTLFQTFQGQRCVNRWNYVASGTPAAVTLSFAMLSAMGFLSETTTLDPDTLAGKIQAVQNSSCFFNSALARAVYIDEDFYENPFIASTVGAQGNDASASSPLNAYGFRSNRVKQSIGRGYKRFAGVEQSLMSSGGDWISAIEDDLQLIADLLGDTLSYDDEGNTLTFIPAVVQKEKYEVEDSGKFAYRYYASQATQLTHTAQGVIWEFYPEMRSQTSRQYGRGI